MSQPIRRGQLNLLAARLKSYRAHTYRTRPAQRLKSEDDALRFVNERGFVYFWPIKGVELPSLWAAVAGDRPVADDHDDPGHVTWAWKDKLLGAKKWFYAKVLRGKSTLISLKTLKYFYALSDNYGDPDDYLIEYEEGRLTQEARQVYEALLASGPLDTLSLRREARLAGKESSTRFEQALVALQRGLKIVPVGVAQAGAWRYAFIYELVGRWLPDLAAEARPIGRGEARAHLADLYLKSVGAATPAHMSKLFGWKVEEAQRACALLQHKRKARRAERVGAETGEWWVSAGLTRR
jgi:hypothetical protein